MVDKLEKLIWSADDIGISEDQIARMVKLLGDLKEKDEETYEGSLDVGILGYNSFEVLNLWPKRFFLSATLHDVGKILIDPEVLKPEEEMSPKEWKKKGHPEMKNHPELSYRFLRDLDLYVAEISLRHHRHQKNPYPGRLKFPELGVPKEDLPEIERASLVVAVLDCYDALKRDNGRNPEEVLYSPTARREKLLEERPKGNEIIEVLYDNGVLE